MYEDQVRVLKTEIAILKEVGGIHKSVRNAVYEKKWTDFDGAQNALNAAAVKLALCEKERVKLFESGSQDSDASSFYAYAATLPPEQRTEIAALYRELKLESAKMRISSGAFNKYLEESSSAVRGFLDAAFPDRRGKLYGRRGAVKETDMRSIVLDRHL
jgi:hypothetical protein